jgi:hypothetical protein
MKFLRRRGRSRTLEYTTWSDMRQRCSNPKHLYYKLYGGAGITVCARWDSFDAFMEDMGPRPFEMVLARKDITLGYTPGNCLWASRGEYVGNRRPTPIMEIDGEKKPLPEWCKKFKISENVVRGRLYNGWNLGKALATPVQKRKA